MRYLLLLVLFLPVATYAADFSGVLVTSNPENPRPNDRVLITATAVDKVPGSRYVWTVDGAQAADDIDAATLSVDAPNAGGSRTVRVTISNAGRTLGTGFITLRPASVTLEWHGVGVRPPFYEGRVPLTAQGTARALAVPTFTVGGVPVRSSDILYTWRVNKSVQQKDSGFGKDSFTITPQFYNSAFTVGVVAATRDGSLTAEDTIAFQPTQPQLVIYEQTPLGGLEDGRAVQGSYPFALDEVSFIAYPLFADPNDSTISWTLDGKTVTLDTGNPRLAVFKKTGAGTGSFSVGAAYQSPSKFLMRAAQSFLLTF